MFPAMDKTAEHTIYGKNLPLNFHEQAGMQLAGLGVTIGIAIFTGALSGLICSKFGEVNELFYDKEHFTGLEPILPTEIKQEMIEHEDEH